MKKLLLLLLWSALPALAQQSSLAMIPDCSAGFCSGLGVPTFNCNTGQRYAQIDNAGTNFTCTGIPEHWVQDAVNAASTTSTSQQAFQGPVNAPQISDVFLVNSSSPTSGTVGGTTYTTAVDLAVANANAWMNTTGKNAVLKISPGAWPTCNGVQLDSTTHNLNIQGSGENVTRIFQSCSITTATVSLTSSARNREQVSDVEFDAAYLAPYSCILAGVRTQVTNVQCSNAAGRAGTSSAISTIARVSGTTTVTTATSHGISAGDFVTIAGVTDSTFNGRMHIASVTNATTFTFTQTGVADASSSAGTATQESAAVAIGPADNEPFVYEDVFTNLTVFSSEASLGAASVTAAVSGGATTGFTVVSPGNYVSFSTGNRTSPGSNLAVHVYGCTTQGSATVTTNNLGGGNYSVASVNQVTPWSGCGTTAYVQVAAQFRVQYALVIGNVTDSTFKDLIPTQPSGTAQMQVLHPYNTFTHAHPYRAAPVLIEDHGNSSYESPEFDSPGGYGMSFLGSGTKVNHALFMWDQQYPGAGEFFLGSSVIGVVVDGVSCGRAQSAGGLHDWTTVGGPTDIGTTNILPASVLFLNATRCDSATTFANNPTFHYSANYTVGPSSPATAVSPEASFTQSFCDAEFSGGNQVNSCWGITHNISTSGFTSTFVAQAPLNSGATSYKYQVAAGRLATSGTNRPAPAFSNQSNYWTGSASAQDFWDFGPVLGSGANPSTTWTLNHSSGSSGQTAVSLPYPLKIATFTVAALPSASALGAGYTVVVTDAAPSTVGACTGGGSNAVVATSNGTTWSCDDVTGVVAKTSLTAQAAAIGATTLYTPSVTGTYRISISAYMTTAASAGTLNVGTNFFSTGTMSSLATGTTAATTIGAVSQGTWTFHATSGTAIQYFVNNNSMTGTYAYGADVVVERLQ
jgi:hypothetical protein